MSWAPDKSDIGESGKCLPLFAFRAPRPAGVGPSPGALALTMLAWGSQEEQKRGRTPEEVVSTYIQNCLSTWERLDVAAIFFISVGAPLEPDLGGGP